MFDFAGQMKYSGQLCEARIILPAIGGEERAFDDLDFARFGSPRQCIPGRALANQNQDASVGRLPGQILENVAPEKTGRAGDQEGRATRQEIILPACDVISQTQAAR
jgi:hypothetical protein